MADDLPLEPGKPRIGELHLDPHGESRPAMLFDNGRDIEVTLNFEHGDPIQRRLVGRNVTWGDDLDYSRHDYSLPEQAWFADPHGIVCLVSPHGRSTSFGPLQEARLRYTYAVSVGSVGARYERLNALQSRIEGLEQWVPIGSVEWDPSGDEDPSASTTLTLRRAAPIPISQTLNAQFRPTYSFMQSTEPGKSVINDQVRVKTSVIRARPWSEHLDVHQGVRDLLVVAGWRNYGTWDLAVSRTDDPERALAGNPLFERWATVATYALPKPQRPVDRERFLFTFEDTGSSGVRRWLALRDRHRRAVLGMIDSVGLPGVALETSVTEAGAALEHLGYGIAIERGETPERGVRKRMERVAAECDCDLGFDLSTWAQRFADAYNTVKHPDRPDQWTSIEFADALRQARLMFRAWVARRIGVGRGRLERNLKLIPMSRPYEPW